MAQRIASFAYDATYTREWYEDWFRQLAAGRDLALSESKTKTESIFTPDQLDAEVSEIWGEDDVAELRQAGKLDLPAEKIDALCGPVTIKTDIFSHPDSDLKLTIDATEDNTMPCIGGWVWMEDELPPIAGFLIIEADDKATVDAVAHDFLAATGRGGARKKS